LGQISPEPHIVLELSQKPFSSSYFPTFLLSYYFRATSMARMCLVAVIRDCYCADSEVVPPLKDQN
jgi:hypothetical protein